MQEYKYLGNERMQLMGFGIVYPNDVIKVKYLINHPLFEVYQKPVVEKKKITKKRYT